MNPFGPSNGRGALPPGVTLGQLADAQLRNGGAGGGAGGQRAVAPDRPRPVLSPNGQASPGAPRLVPVGTPQQTTNPTMAVGTLHPGAQPTGWRTIPPFGPLFDLIRSPNVPPFERQYRKETNNTWYAPTVSPQQPVTFEVGGLVIPPTMHLFVTGYEFKLYRVSGTGNNTVPVEPESMSTILGFDITINGQRSQRDCQYQLAPVPVSTSPILFQPRPVAGDKTRGAQVLIDASASEVTMPGGAGSAALPNRPARMGPEDGPFTLFVAQNEALAGSVTIFRPLSVPLAFIQFVVRGVMVDRTTAESVFPMTGLK